MKKYILAALFVGATVAGAAQAAPPREFLKDAMQGDNGEIRMGAMALSRARSPGVRSYGRTLNQDHSTAKSEVIAVARPYGVRPTNAMTPDAREAYDHLSRLRGRAFDREFVQHMLDDHRKDIAKFEEQARSGDRRTAALARKQLPVLRKHLRIAESLSR